MPQVLAEVPLTARVMDNGCIEILGMEDLPQDAPCLWASCSNAGFTVCATAAVQSSLYVLNGLIGGTQDLLKAKVMARMAQAQHWPADQPEPCSSHPLQAERELEQRWLHNNMLNKWLEYCLDLGHSLA